MSNIDEIDTIEKLKNCSDQLHTSVILGKIRTRNASKDHCMKYEDYALPFKKHHALMQEYKEIWNDICELYPYDDISFLHQEVMEKLRKKCEDEKRVSDWLYFIEYDDSLIGWIPGKLTIPEKKSKLFYFITPTINTKLTTTKEDKQKAIDWLYNWIMKKFNGTTSYCNQSVWCIEEGKSNNIHGHILYEATRKPYISDSPFKDYNPLKNKKPYKITNETFKITEVRSTEADFSRLYNYILDKSKSGTGGRYHISENQKLNF